jgi:hypothetical protein
VCPVSTIYQVAVAGLLAVACASAKPSPVKLIRPEAAVKHARGDQVGIAVRDGAPDVVKFHTASSVAQWMYCGDEGDWVRVIDFDGNGNVLISLDLPDQEGSVCIKKQAQVLPSQPLP